MAFNPAMNWLENTYHGDRYAALRGGQRLKWSTDSFISLAKMNDMFDSTEEDKACLRAMSNKSYSVNEMIGLRGKLAWLCGCRRDVRMQFCAESSSRHRGSLDHHRFEALRLIWAKKGLTRLRELLTKERVK